MTDRIRLARERALRVAELAGDEESAKRLRAALKPKPKPEPKPKAAKPEPKGEKK